MKKIPFILLIIICCFIIIRPVFSQSPSADLTFDRAYQDYSYNLSLYDAALNTYKNAKAQYLQYNTLTAKEDSTAATLKLLQARDEVVITYLTSLRRKIAELPGVFDNEKGPLLTNIDGEVSFYTEHKGKLTSAGSLEDLVSDSNTAKERYESATKIVIYSSLIGIGTGKNEYDRGMLEKSLNDLKGKVSEINTNGDKDVTAIERSLIDMANKIERSKVKDQAAKDLINAMSKSEDDKESVYIEAIGNAQNSQLYLKEVNKYLLEIVRQIKSN